MDKDKFRIIDNWSIGESINNNYPMVIRFRNQLDSLNGKELFPHLLQVYWTFSNLSDTGMPDRTEAMEASEFEDFLINSIEDDLQSILAFVTTNNGLRIWHIYTNDINEFSNRLHNIPHKYEKYPIEIYLIPNENWKSYNDVRENYKA